MKIADSQWQFAAASSSQSVSPAAFRLSAIKGSADTPVSQQVLSWLLFWPLLTLIARQIVYFSGPAVGSQGAQNGAGSAHVYWYIYLLSLLGFVLAGHRMVWQVIKRNPLIFAILALAVCSALWSSSPQITLQMSIQVGLCTLFACYLSARYTSERLMQLLIFMGVASSFLTILFVFALPGYGLFQGHAGAWQGICDHKNTLGLSMAFLVSPVFFVNSYSRGRRLLYCGLLLFLIYESQSRGAWFDTCGMLLFVGWLAVVRRIRHRELTLLIFLTATLGTAILVLCLHFWPMLAGSVGKDPSMTGRTQIYAEVWRSIMKRPLLGYGFDTFWIPSEPESRRIGFAIAWPGIGYAESGILEMAAQIGFVGVGLIVAMFAKAVVQGVHFLRSPHYSPRIGWFLTVLFLAALTNIDAGWFMTPNTLDWVLILVSCIGMNDAMHPNIHIPTEI
jgi:exopolysaccharide production protein ExoQ